MHKYQPIFVLGTIIAWAWLIRSIVLQVPMWAWMMRSFLGKVLRVE